MKDRRVTKIVVDVIKTYHPEWWQFARANSFTDDAGNPINVRDDGICWESTDWCDYEILDVINGRIEREELPFVVEYQGSYEVSVEAL